MTRLESAEAVRRAAAYLHAIVSYLDGDGFPVSVAGAFTADVPTATVEIGPLSDAVLPAPDQEVCVIVSHIRPQPGVGYDERRYVTMWGPARVTGTSVAVTVERASGWDESETPFFEYAERNVPTGRRYLDEVGARPRLSRWWTFFLATRLPFLTATLVPVALGGVVAARDRAFDWPV